MTSPCPISCLNCGYSIADLAPDSLCPECAYPIARTNASHQIFGDSIANPLALARLLRVLGSLQLAATLLLCTVIAYPRIFLVTSDRLESIAYLSGLTLWLALSFTWFLVTAPIVRQSRTVFALLALFRGVLCVLLLAAIALLIASYTNRLQSFTLGPLNCVALAAIIEICLVVSTSVLIRDITFALPKPGRLPLLNIGALLYFYIAIIAALASISYPHLAFAVPFAPALSSIRSFTLSRRIRAAINNP